MYLGKLIGFFMGSLIYGPLGGVFALIVGHVFDLGIRKNMVSQGHATKIQRTFFSATFSVMGHVAKMDGRVTEREIKSAEGIMQRLRLNIQQRKMAMGLFSKGKDNRFHLESVLYELYQVCHQQRDILRLFIQFQLETALPEGNLNSEKRDALLSICQFLRFSPEEFAQLQARQKAEETFYQRHYHSYEEFDEQSGRHGNKRQSKVQSFVCVQDAYVVLGVEESATKVQVKKAYRKLMSQYHPDKLISKGLPSEMLLFAKEKTQEIQAAYELICQQRGF